VNTNTAGQNEQLAVSTNVLMYHSIARASGPTSISPETFKRQIEILVDCGYRTISIASFRDWLEGKTEPPARSVLLTFDDGFADFAECAFEILKTHACTATVFLPSGKIGGMEDWAENGSGGRSLMSWSQVIDLSRENVDFGGHSVTHTDLTKLSGNELEREIRQCRDQIELKLGRPPIAFAPPYGRAMGRERREIQNWFDVSLGTRLDRAYRNCNRYDVPRIEMHYFRDLDRWRGYLEGRAEWYLKTRQALRRVRGLVRQ
jgi:peptidoglycan/xylan/chitin deacetylase (PgdA/CDA1 family)